MRKRNSCAILALSALMLCSCGGGGGANVNWTVSFNSQGGSDVPSQTVRHGNKASKPTDPTYQGFEFKGWFKDEAAVTPFSFDTVITANWTLYAGWTLKASPDQSTATTSTATTITSNPDETIVYSVSGMPEWIQNDDCVIFAWVWSPNDSGSWKSLTYTDKTAATFNVAEELTGFLLARCIKDTTVPDWSIKDNTPGRIYNQTENIDCTSGVYAYTCAQWKEYK